MDRAREQHCAVCLAPGHNRRRCPTLPINPATEYGQAILRRADRLDRIECDCGRPKRSVRDECCVECRFRDGGTMLETELIDALRVGVEMTAKDLAMKFDCTAGNMLIRLNRLMARGRVTRRWAENDGLECMQRCRYGSGPRRAVTGGSGHWAYALCDRRAA